MPALRRYIIYNPAAGKGRAVGRFAQFRDAVGDGARYCPTMHPGHAEELALDAAQNGAEVIVAAGGDGTVHEVANGILKSTNSSVQFSVLPLGSANDYLFSLEHGLPIGATAADVGRVRDGSGRERYFVCCLGLGLNSAVTMEARRIPHLQGMALYGLAALRAVTRHFRHPKLHVQFDDGTSFTKPTLMMSVLVGRREGGFVMAPDAQLDDGVMEYVHAGELSRWDVVGLLPRLALFGPPTRHPQIQLGQCRSVRLQSEAPLTIHTDGEFFCAESDDVRCVEITVMPRMLHIRRDELASVEA